MVFELRSIFFRLVSALHSVLSCLGAGGVLLVLCTIVGLVTVVPCDMLVLLPCFAILGRRDDVSLAMLSGALYVCDTVPAFHILDSSVLLVCRLFGFLCWSLRKCRTSPGCLTFSLFFCKLDCIHYIFHRVEIVAFV